MCTLARLRAAHPCSFRSGDWASGVWGSAGIPGQEQSCAQRTGVATCEQFVRQNGASFNEACVYRLFRTSAVH
jgi:hypothetical protein